jgi:hypothetical protein
MEKYQWIFTLESQLVIALIGMLLHFLKKKVTGETIVEIKQYFSNNFKSTFIAFITTVLFTTAYYLTLETGTPADIIVSISIGYTFDSALNKWDSK